jgi:hypothetical protein
MVLFTGVLMESGTAFLAARVGEGPTRYDPERGLVYITEDERPDDVVVEIATGTGIGVLDGYLHSVWLKPKME